MIISRSHRFAGDLNIPAWLTFVTVMTDSFRRRVLCSCANPDKSLAPDSSLYSNNCCFVYDWVYYSKFYMSYLYFPFVDIFHVSSFWSKLFWQLDAAVFTCIMKGSKRSSVCHIRLTNWLTHSRKAYHLSVVQNMLYRYVWIIVD